MNATHQRRQIGRWRELPASERDAAELYDRLAAAEPGERRAVLAELAQVERRHAAHWETKLREAGADASARTPVSVRTRFRQLLAGGLAALVTFGVGHLIGVSVS